MTRPPAYARIRNPNRKVEDEAVAHAILDQGLVAHVGFIAEDRPMVIPMAYARDGDRLYIHGASKTRAVARTGGLPMCLTVTLLDGIVAARSAFHHSVNYRSVVVHGMARKVTGREEFDRALRLITEHLLPGRYDEIRANTAQEEKATGVLALDIEVMTVKVRSGPPVDDEADHALDLWSGVLPVTTAIGRGVPDGFTRADRPEPASFARARTKFLT
ncbi:pyridoxamine 5'-phosphate oxidase family protein [Defluviimonas sp. WL0024]|uniref:Pyridoxamine 5'-phosphate oxidase family protein n=2 Tax=Albidovulum TaxID=205889 RepID=A0ABT3J1N8_9RHOB|nr:MULTISPECIES: pyridoxamine 5'-phosphate oxidase family protein [Defluviimonas]MCU9847402.1 pyridoxamine 5'-phosphate oxidase family protein [Defluviimonas sp. WL0024]MCW3781593.1 pyridoxamine 5'-phosphate oxidase family protein [Defluviimonas salinarum]